MQSVDTDGIEVADEVEYDEPTPGGLESNLQGGSLAERAEAARRSVAAQQEEVFPFGSYGDVLKVRYRAVPWSTVTAIRKRQAKVRDESTREMYIATEILLASAQEAIEVRPDGSERELGHGIGLELAQALELDDQLPNGATDRQALIKVFGAFGNSGTFHLMQHFGEVWEWMTSIRGDLDGSVEELYEDRLTALAVRLALLKIPVDVTRLWESEEDDLILWLETVVKRVEAAHKKAEQEVKRRNGGR